MTAVLLFVPGLLGSELLDDQGKVWPGSLFQGALGFDEAHFQRLLKPDLKVGGIVEKAAGVVNVYGKWLDAFEKLTVSGKKLFSRNANPKTLYTAPYDWRLDLMETAEKSLAAIIDKIHADHGGQQELHIVAHSLGGLQARFYLQSGRFNQRPAFAKIASFTTFGTPHNGAPVALAGALGLHKTSFMSIDQSQRLAKDPRYPALYQTFPRMDEPIFWARAAADKLQPKTLSDQTFVTNVLRLEPQNLAKVKALHDAIDLAQHPLPKTIRVFLLIGTRFDTITHFEFAGNTVSKVETPDAGDGTVSLQGAYLPGLQMQFSGEAHVDLIDSGKARSAFQRLFGADGLAFLQVGRINLSVRDQVVAPEGHVQLALLAEGGVRKIQGKLVWEKARLAPGAQEFKEEDFGAVADPPPTPIQYDGPEAQSIMVDLKAPALTGIYRIVLKRDNQADERSPAFVVRQ